MFSLIKSRLGVSNTVSCWEEKRVVESVSGAFIGFKVGSLAKQKCHMYPCTAQERCPVGREIVLWTVLVVRESGGKWGQKWTK